MPRAQRTNDASPSQSQSTTQIEGGRTQSSHARHESFHTASGLGFTGTMRNQDNGRGVGTDERTNSSPSTITGIREATQSHQQPEHGWNEYLGDSSTYVPSAHLGPYRHQHGTLCTGSTTTVDAAMVHIGPGDLDAESLGLDDTSSEDGERYPPQDITNIAFRSEDQAPLPPSLVEQAIMHAKQSSNLLSEDDFRHFMNQPLEARQQNMNAYFGSLIDLGPEFGVTNRLSLED